LHDVAGNRANPHCPAGNVDDADESELYLPTDDKHFMDYVVALVDEFAPDRDDYEASHAHIEEKALESAERRDGKTLEKAKAALGKAQKAQKKEQDAVAKVQKSIDTDVKKQQKEAKKVEARQKTAAADAKKESEDVAKLKAEKKEVRTDKKTEKADKAKLVKEKSKLRKDEQVSRTDRRKHEQLASKVIDTSASVQKDELHVNDDTNELNRAKADVQQAKSNAPARDHSQADRKAEAPVQEAAAPEPKDDHIEPQPHSASSKDKQDAELRAEEQKAEEMASNHH